MTRILILDNIRSFHNVGSLLRTAEAFGVTNIIACGITPHMRVPYDARLPHVIMRAERQLAKTALGAEKIVKFKYCETAAEAIAHLDPKITVYGLEQAENSVDITSKVFPDSWALVLGNEVEGLEPDTMKTVTEIIEIPQTGNKESLNVTVAAGIGLYALLHQTK